MVNLTPFPKRFNRGNIEISAQPEYLNSRINGGNITFAWSYHIKITNISKRTFQLTKRHWQIIDVNGGIENVSGDGVVGTNPILKPNDSFEYSSAVNLNCPSGVMMGHYDMADENGVAIKVKIPSFSLDVPDNKSVVVH
jgi:ApaG protein